MERLPHLRRGLKRGFTFYGHDPGRRFANGRANERRLLVAASPTDRVADTHWLREDVDHHLAREAGAAGVEVLEEVDLTGLEKLDGGWRLSGTHQGRSVASRPICWSTPQARADSWRGTSRSPRSRPLSYPWSSGTSRGGCLLRRGGRGGAPRRSLSGRAGGRPPHPGGRWMYVLPFDHGTVSAGFVIAEERAREELSSCAPDGPGSASSARYPTLRDQFAPPVQRGRSARSPASRTGFARAPGTAGSSSRMPSASSRHSSRRGSPGACWRSSGWPCCWREGRLRGSNRYGDLLETGSGSLQRILAGAYEADAGFRPFRRHSSSTSPPPVSARPATPPPGPGGRGAWAWNGIPGEHRSRDPGEALTASFLLFRDRTSRRRSGTLSRRANWRAWRNQRETGFTRWIWSLVKNAGLLGLTREEIRREIPRLRG